jgi:hypothetical protein
LGNSRERLPRINIPRFKKEFTAGRHKPFGKTSDYLNALENADLAKLAKVIKLVGMLMQTKVYLFWKRD